MKAGFLRLFGVVLMAALFSACAAPSPPDQDAARVLALGDSYTAGEGVTLSESWPQQLAALLRQNGQTVSDLTVVARSGWTSDDLLTGLQEANPQGPYDLVVLLIGANDQFRGYPPESYRSNLSHLLSPAIHLAGGQAGRVVVLSIPDWSQAPAGALFDPREAADDVARSKPDPETYRLAVERLRAFGSCDDLTPGSCVAIEDTVTGIQSARRAGLVVLGVANSYPADELRPHADCVVESLDQVGADKLSRLVETAKR